MVHVLPPSLVPWALLLLAALLSTTQQGSAAADAINADAEVLLELKAGFANGDALLPSWDNQTSPCGGGLEAGWAGITCDGSGAVTDIWLPDLGLEGPLPALLPDGLQILNLANNSLRGSLEGLEELPAGLAAVLLQNNLLEGSLPTWPDITNETVVVVAPGNEGLCGEVPADPLIYYVADDAVNVPLGPLPSCQASPSPQAPPSPLQPSPAPPPLSPVPPPPPSPSTPSLSGPSTDAQLLLEFRKSFSNGDTVLEDWVGNDPCGRGWIGVTCNSRGVVTDISLAVRGLRGTIPEGGWQLPQGLEELSLFYNQVYGKLPASWALPPGLAFLSLGANELTGEIPQSFFSQLPPSLRSLYLDDNQLQGPLPTWSAAPSVAVFVLPGNQDLCGEVPPAMPYFMAPADGVIQQLSSLPTCPAVDPTAPSPALPLSQLPPLPVTSIPDEQTSAASQAAAAQLLELKGSFSNGNTLLGDWAGEDPCTRGGWTGISCDDNDTVTQIWLADVGLKGTIPPGGWPLPEGLRVLSLHANSISGSLPEEFEVPGSLEELILSQNQLNGSLPASWDAALPTALNTLALMDNELSGSLPTWSNLPDIQVYMAPGNEGLCGEVPEAPQFAMFDYNAATALSLVDPVVPLTNLTSCQPD